MSSLKRKIVLVACAALAFGATSAMAQLTPVIVKAFGASTVPLNGTTTLTFTITDTVALTGISFTDTLPAGLVVATPNGLTTTCPGAVVTAVAGSGVVSVAPFPMQAIFGCTITVNVTGTTAGVKTNSVTVSDTVEGVGNTFTATLTVLAPPSVLKTFSPASVAVGGVSAVSVTITNPNGTGLTGVSFSDTLPAGLTFASPSGLAANCGGVAVAAVGPPAVLSLSGGILAGGASCTVSANVIATVAGQYSNAVAASATDAGTGNTSTATLNAFAPPVLTKSFADSMLTFSPVTALTFTVTNPNPFGPLTGVGFSDSLPSGLVVSTPNGLTGSCDGGTISAVAGSSTISLSNATLAAGASCTFSVSVTGAVSTSGPLVNTTLPVTSNEGGTGVAATSTINDQQYMLFLWWFS